MRQMVDRQKDLVREYGKLDRAIAALKPRRKKRKAKAKAAVKEKKRGRPKRTKAQRLAASKRMKQYWADKRVKHAKAG